MLITRWTPPRTLSSFPYFFNRFPDSGSERSEDSTLPDFAPVVDIEEKEKAYVVMVELPGVKKDDVKVNLKDNVLTISGEKKMVEKIDEKNLHQAERIFGSFRRCFRLPELVDQEKITAEFRDGILNIAIPKAAVTQPKSIEIKVK